MSPAETKKERDVAMDWIKGALVVSMVVYHSLNYSPFSAVAFHYLAFLPPSFIFIAGFLLTNSYLARYDVRDWRLHRRLLIRGAKLILVFTVLNLGLYLMAYGSQGLQQFAKNWQAIYSATSGRVASFYVLASIGYLLLLAPILLGLCSLSRWLIPALMSGLSALCLILEWNGSGDYHLSMVNAGMIGMVLGFLSLEGIAQIARKWSIVLPLYCLYRFCSYALGDPYAVQLMGVGSSLLLLYGLALVMSAKGLFYQQVVLLGRYSLFGYIIQLAILQAIVRTVGVFNTPSLVLSLTVVTLTLTWAATLAVDRLRAKARLFDLTYKTVFA